MARPELVVIRAATLGDRLGRLRPVVTVLKPNPRASLVDELGPHSGVALGGASIDLKRIEAIFMPRLHITRYALLGGAAVVQREAKAQAVVEIPSSSQSLSVDSVDKPLHVGEGELVDHRRRRAIRVQPMEHARPVVANVKGLRDVLAGHIGPWIVVGITPVHVGTRRASGPPFVHADLIVAQILERRSNGHVFDWPLGIDKACCRSEDDVLIDIPAELVPRSPRERWRESHAIVACMGFAAEEDDDDTTAGQ
mmetsp:Transcript_49328/g.81908  ORF Transcript_49328/g.81908 Transcript_49328/m.81908 type:complete len:253 (-) Transcript_49328:200-958(-)